MRTIESKAALYAKVIDTKTIFLFFIYVYIEFMNVYIYLRKSFTLNYSFLCPSVLVLSFILFQLCETDSLYIALVALELNVQSGPDY